MIVSCFIYNNETTQPRFRQSLPEHLFQNCFASGGGWLTTEIVPFIEGTVMAATILFVGWVSPPYAKLTHDRYHSGDD